MRQGQVTFGRREQVWIRRYSPAGDILWTRRERTDTPQVASAVMVDGAGDAVVVGGGPTGGHSRGWLRRYSPDGEPRPDELWLGDGPRTHILDVVGARDGRLWLSFYVSDGTYSRPWLAGLGADGQVAEEPDAGILHVWICAGGGWSFKLRSSLPQCARPLWRNRRARTVGGAR